MLRGSITNGKKRSRCPAPTSQFFGHSQLPPFSCSAAPRSKRGGTSHFWLRCCSVLPAYFWLAWPLSLAAEPGQGAEDVFLARLPCRQLPCCRAVSVRVRLPLALEAAHCLSPAARESGQMCRVGSAEREGQSRPTSPRR